MISAFERMANCHSQIGFMNKPYTIPETGMAVKQVLILLNSVLFFLSTILVFMEFI